MDLAEIADALRFMAHSQSLAAQHAVITTTDDAPLKMLNGHYQAIAFLRAAAIVENYKDGRGEPMGPSVSAMAKSYREYVKPR